MYLRVDTSIECSTTGAYPMLLGFTVPLIILYQSIPLLWWYDLRAKRAKLDPPIEDKDRAYRKRAKDHSVAHLGFLVADYRCGMYYYEVIDMYRRIVLLG